MRKKSKEQIFEERQKMGVKQSLLPSKNQKECIGILNQILNKEPIPCGENMSASFIIFDVTDIEKEINNEDDKKRKEIYNEEEN